jgi:formate dehydrogenase subunit delta
MKINRLIDMANQIANFFEAEEDREVAVADVANHLKKYWNPRMRRQLVDHVDAAGDEGLSSLVVEALQIHRASLCGGGQPILADDRWVGEPGSSDAG